MSNALRPWRLQPSYVGLTPVQATTTAVLEIWSLITGVSARMADVTLPAVEIMCPFILSLIFILLSALQYMAAQYICSANSDPWLVDWCNPNSFDTFYPVQCQVPVRFVTCKVIYESSFLLYLPRTIHRVMLCYELNWVPPAQDQDLK